MIVSAYYGCEPGGVINYNGVIVLASKDGPFGVNSAAKFARQFKTDIQILHCYDDQTEILTNKGWKNGTELEEEDMVGVLDSSSHRLEYRKPDHLFISYYKGPMYYLENKYVNLFVTPEHKMYVRKRGKKDFERIKVQDISFKRAEYLIAPGMFSPEEYQTPDDFGMGLDNFLKLLGLYISEGSCSKTSVFIYQSKISGRKEIRDFLSTTSLKWKEFKGYFCIYSRELASFFKGLGHSLEKYIPREYLELPSEKLEILWKYLLIGDGWITKSGTEIYCSSSKKLIDNVQELLLKCGFGAVIRINAPERFNKKLGYTSKINWSVSKIKNITPRTIPDFKGYKGRYNFTEEWREYEGLVWCVNFGKERDLVIVRRNGKPVIGVRTDWWAFSQFPDIMPFPIIYCYDKETEVLTDQGWKYFKDLDGSEEVGVLNDEKLEFEKPKRYFVYPYNGKMYRLKSKFIDLMVSPNHNLYIKEKMQNNYKLKKARELFGIYKTFKKNAKWEGIRKDFFVLPKYSKEWKLNTSLRRYTKEERKIPMDLWLEFLGYYLSEGSCSKWSVIISQSPNSPYYKDMIKACDNIGYQPKIYGKNIIIFDTQLVSYLRQFGKASEKYISKEYRSLPSEQLKILLTALRKGDGDKARPRYATKSKRLADDIQEVSIKAGYAIDVHYSRTGDDYRLIFSEKFKEVRDRHRSKKNGFEVNSLEEFVPYNGMVYCVETNPSILLVRRNGKEYFCGNSPMDHQDYPEEILSFTRKYKKIISLCDWQKGELQKKGIDSTVIPHGVDISIYKPQDKQECRKRLKLGLEDKFVFGTVAANSDKEDRKNHAGMIKAMQYFLEENPDVKDVVWLYHSNPIDPRGMPLSNIVHKHKLDNIVRFLDPGIFDTGLSEEEMSILYNAMDVHLLCSKREGFGIPIIESMACSIPNIVHNFSSPVELVKGRGWLVKSMGTGINYMTTPLNAETGEPDNYDLADKLKRAYFNTNERTKFSKASREFAINYNWDDIITNKWIPFLGSLELGESPYQERRLL
jgi:glycosyltransferase involved in cell wall biosynthesis